MPVLQRLVGGSVFLVALALLPVAAWAQGAQLIVTGGAGATAINTFPPPRSFSLTSPTGPVSIPETTVSANAPGSSGTATIVGTAQYGRFSARASAAATAAGMFDLGAGNASVNLTSIDFLQVTGAPGATITFRLRLVVSGSVAAGPPKQCLNVASFLAQAAISSRLASARPTVRARSSSPSSRGRSRSPGGVDSSRRWWRALRGASMSRCPG